MSLKSAALFEALKKSFGEESKAATAKKANAIFQIDVKGGADGKITTWFIDLKGNADVVSSLGAGKKPDVTVIIGDSDLIDLATGKTTGQKAFSTGKLKVKGNVMQVMKIEGILKGAVSKAKL